MRCSRGFRANEYLSRQEPSVGEAFRVRKDLRDAPSVLLRRRRRDERIPIIRRVSVIQLLPEASVRVRLASSGTETLLVIDPTVDDASDRREIPEEQSESACTEFVSTPVSPRGAEGVPLLVVRCGGVQRDLLHHGVIQVRHDFLVRGRDGSSAKRPLGLALLQARHRGCGEALELVNERRMEEKDPPIYDDCILRGGIVG